MGKWAEFLTTGIKLDGGKETCKGSIDIDLGHMLKLCVSAAAPSRKEIRDLSSLELILLREGLAKFQNERRADDPKSWFQIAGTDYCALH